MAQPIFDFVADKLEENSHLEKLEARGTVRLALKGAGLDPRSLTTEQMLVILQKVLPAELKSRGVEAPERICEQLITLLKQNAPAGADAAGESPEDVFRRLGH